ncbi:L-serine ammonia-lyase, iron-sulfur-dependent subunit beta [Paenibacillus eucommiae]|uniref:L-serine deaminase n=1 Tax=Paenibacillus eucommiae TaxID=1355755 RepID=A0ABS4J6U3_9BACL|nr:L-serine ammonia-lyase, iron-sulfur-dependent subunit beta [Paenibacillus eucommiae]MBP1994826.1 L-serine dehydratase [Paenibacillus eucommiae]
MRFKDVFSIIGPAMVGPSSSHTAGAVRLGRVARHLFGSLPDAVEIVFYGSFADTYQGHGTDLAIVSGLLDYDTDDPRIPTSLIIAAQLGLDIQFKQGKGQSWHPNTAKMTLYSDTRKLSVIGASIGGGNIEIINVNDFDVKFTGEYPTLVIFHQDRTGLIADVADLLRREAINIGHMDVDRKGRSGDAMTVIEVDSTMTEPLLQEISGMSGVYEVKKVELMERRLS